MKRNRCGRSGCCGFGGWRSEICVGEHQLKGGLIDALLFTKRLTWSTVVSDNLRDERYVTYCPHRSRCARERKRLVLHSSS